MAKSTKKKATKKKTVATKTKTVKKTVTKTYWSPTKGIFTVKEEI